jgi:hypothetical protein
MGFGTWTSLAWVFGDGLEGFGGLDGLDCFVLLLLS